MLTTTSVYSSSLWYPILRPSKQLLQEPTFPYGEDLLQFIWASRLFDHRGLATTDGLPIESISPGTIQKNSGPDLDNALLRIGGQLWAGTVEVHLRSSEWNIHGHQFDPAYDNVVLHVVFEHDLEVFTVGSKRLPTLELKRRIATERIAMYQQLMGRASFVPCASQLHTIDPGHAQAWLDHVLRERLHRKADRVLALFDEYHQDRSQVFHHLLLEGIGLRTNAGPMGMLARSLPLRILLKYRDDPARVKALLLGQAGLLSDLPADGELLSRIHEALARLHGLQPIPLAAWKLGRIRPANHPLQRLLQFIDLFLGLEGSFDVLLHAEDISAIRRIFQASSSFGRGAIDHLIINAVVPMLVALGRVQGKEHMEQRAFRFLRQLPPETNELLQKWASIGQKSGDAAHGQALLELKASYCSPRRCLTCGIGMGILKRTANG
jgi:hypothetical protein